MTKLTATALGIPSLRAIKGTVGKDNHAMIAILVAHNKELVRQQASPGNWGWVISEDGIASKTDKGILSTDAYGCKWEARYYTIAFTPEMVIAVVPDPDDIDAAIAAAEREAGETFHDYSIERGLTLTDEPSKGEELVFTSINGSCGFLTAADGRTYDYAVR